MWWDGRCIGLPLMVGWVISLMVKREERLKRRGEEDERQREKGRRERSMRRRKVRREFALFGRIVFVLFRFEWGASAKRNC